MGDSIEFSLREPDRVIAEDSCSLENAEVLLTRFLTALTTWPFELSERRIA